LSSILKCSGKVNVALYLGVDFLKMFIVTVFLVKNSWIFKIRKLEALSFLIKLYLWKPFLTIKIQSNMKWNLSKKYKVN